ncbi:hypothetical protein Y032_0094g2692 [Ancylostoma ceylanicum]|uniref:Uncharacterized protein n=1 Tax=Ancylostoma ceylanicum TaxID=53326 RepID=A0A016TKV8_9BILA|nr:hypothetical protein Y032_0094g2692 [Ancylostoma ceylanicum]
MRFDDDVVTAECGVCQGDFAQIAASRRGSVFGSMICFIAFATMRAETAMDQRLQSYPHCHLQSSLLKMSSFLQQSVLLRWSHC